MCDPEPKWITCPKCGCKSHPTQEKCHCCDKIFKVKDINEITCPDCKGHNVKLVCVDGYCISIKCPDCGWYITIATQMIGGIYVRTKDHPEGALYE